MNAEYDFLIVGAGLFGAILAHELKNQGKKCLVLDKRNHIGGNCYTKEMHGINVHMYGAHIFHTSDEKVWKYVNSFCEFNRFTNAPIVNWKGEIYNLPFNMNTFNKLWGVVSPKDAKAIIEAQRQVLNGMEPQNLEEQAISLVGTDIYEKLIKGYTEKQWGRKCTELPPFIIRRLPVRFTYDNNYFEDKYQGIPMGGYTRLFEQLLDGIEVRLGVDYLQNRIELGALAETVIYTGPIDSYYGFQFGHLEYRSLAFENETLEMENYQGNAVVNYSEADVAYTRIIEHKHFEFGHQKYTVLTREYPKEWTVGSEPYYPINDAKNSEIFAKYKDMADQESHVLFGGRLADYKYYDMHLVVAKALELAERIGMGG